MRARAAILIAGLFAFCLPACNDSTNNGTPVITVGGETVVALGTTAQLTATTTNGVDTGYQWVTMNPVVAGVDATGMVTGRAAGQADVTATGNQTGVTGTFRVVVTAEPSQGVPNYDDWSTSPHNDHTAEAFRHWDDTGVIPTSCARCHSTPGLRDYFGDDGTPAGSVENPVPVGSTVECQACHSEASVLVSSVTFPSGVVIDGLGREAVCMTCHQGRASSDTVDAAIAKANPANDDTQIEDQGFINVHYFPAGATRYGSQVRAGYLYEGKSYDVLFRHVPGLDKCQNCHNPHSLEVKIEVCQDCHSASTVDDLKNIRMESSVTRDYDGDGDLFEGLWYEIDTLRDKLLTAIENYAEEVNGVPIRYDEHAYPYWIRADTGGSYTDYFTPRLLKATFNYQYAVKDPGGFAHNGKFIIQLLHDSIEDLNNSAMTSKVDMSGAVRTDRGHFDGTAEAFRHWDGEGEVSSSCVRCHSGSYGYEEYLTYKATTNQPIASGMDCATCHTTFDTFETRRITSVEFPSGLSTPTIGAAVPTEDPSVQANICITCHQGRVSKKSIDDAIASNNLRFQNVHYLAAAATLFGTEAQVGYEYEFPGWSYEGKFQHAGTGSNTNNCVFCHSPSNTQHTFLPDDNKALCRICHAMPNNSLHDIRLNRPIDYDGDGDNTEPLSDELETFADALLAEIQAYARNVIGVPILYDGHGYPYFFRDTNDDGSPEGSYNAWDAKLIKAAHNYQHSQKEPGAWAHNLHYILQLVHDSIYDLGDSNDVLDGFNVPGR